ncbi:MAG: hypothetical protein U0L55_04515 [Acutalibacteraceae bacterium]|nr:hypothetical protein [Acutalibacteraceae bacterium]
MNKLKILIKSIIFTVIFALILSTVNHTLVKVDDTGYQNISGFYEEPDDTLDAVYVGSSNCFVFWNSLLAWKEYGISVYPYACNSNLFFSTEYLIKEARKTQPNATFIVNINSLNEGEVNLQQMRNLIDNMPFSLNKLALIHHMSNVGDYSFEDRLEFYFPNIRYHSRWSEVTSEDLDMELNGFKGASVYKPYLTISEDVSLSYNTTNEEIALSEKIISSTEGLLDYCDKENVKVLFVTVPQAKSENEMSRYNALNTMIEGRGYPVLNLNDHMDEMGIDIETDFYNRKHTNIHGSVKFTKYLSEYLIENYNFTDKRKNPDYISWNEAYDEYQGEIASYTLDLERDFELRANDLESPVIRRYKFTDYASIRWDAVQGAKGYAIYKKAEKTGAWERILTTSDLQCEVSIPSTGNVDYYTIVPFYTKNGETYYGDFLYGGAKITSLTD